MDLQVLRDVLNVSSQRAVSRATGITRWQIEKIMKDDETVRYGTVKKLYEFFHLK